MSGGYTPTRPNLLPASGLSGGQANLVGWFAPGGAVAPDNGDGTLSLARDSSITTADTSGGVAVARQPARAGSTFTAAVTADSVVILALLWVGGDGLVTVGPTSFGAGRVAVSGVAPASVIGVLVQVVAPTARVTSQASTSETVTYYQGMDAGPYAFYADAGNASPALLSYPVLTSGTADPGPTPPTPIDTSLGNRMYQMLPAMYRADDVATGYTLQRFLAGISAGANETQAVVDLITSGALTDPINCPDAWVPWLAQAAGIPSRPGLPVADLRALLVAQNLAPVVGSRAAIAAVARRYLTGSRIADVSPSPSDPWRLNVRVKSDELVPPGDTATLAANIMATGQVPAGCYVFVFTGLPTWAQYDAAIVKWSDAEGKRWADLDSIGVTGL